MYERSVRVTRFEKATSINTLQFNQYLFRIIEYVGCTKMSYTFRDDEDDA